MTTRAGDPLVARFERRPAAYDRQLWMEWRALRVAALLAGPLRGARVVDVAAGTGGLAAALVRRGPAVASLALVDASPAMLRRAGRRLAPAVAEGRVPPPVVRVADARDTGLPAGSADLVTMGYLLHLLDAPARAGVLAEARRLLAPGGRLVVVVHGAPRGPAGRAYRAAWGLLARPAGAVGTGPMRDPAAVLRAAGFAVQGERRVAGPYWSHVLRARI